MKFLDGLIKFFPALKKLNLKFFTKNHLHLTLVEVNNGCDQRTQTLSLAKLSETKRKKLLSSILPRALKDGTDILPKKFDDNAEDYKEKINVEQNLEILEYFRDKIPNGDLSILKASLYLRSLLKGGKDTGVVKQGIVQNYGRRGANISNLVTGGYFESWFKPLYEEMIKTSNFSIEKFQSAYNEVVVNLPFTLFVNSSMSGDVVKEKIKEKLETAEKYGIVSLNIHGIGERNVKIIRSALEKIPETNHFEREIEEKGEIIVIRLRKKNETTRT